MTRCRARRTDGSASITATWVRRSLIAEQLTRHPSPEEVGPRSICRHFGLGVSRDGYPRCAARVLRAPRASPDDRRCARGRRRNGHRACRSEEHTSELQSLMRISYAVFCLKKKKHKKNKLKSTIRYRDKMTTLQNTSNSTQISIQ